MSDLHKSEVARFREQQALEEEAARLALSGYAITARHDLIIARIQRGGERVLRLIAEGKHDEAQVLMNSENWGVEDALSIIVGAGVDEGKGGDPCGRPRPSPPASLGLKQRQAKSIVEKKSDAQK